MYPYHNKIKQRIKNKELIRYEFVEKYKNISPCLLLYFDTEPFIRPIRQHRFKEYEELFKQIENPDDQRNHFFSSAETSQRL